MTVISLVTPPLLQLNTPYPAVPMLTDYLRKTGVTVYQHDFSIDFALRVFTPEIVEKAVMAAKAMPPARRDESLEFFIESGADYAATVLDTVAFLQGKRPELAWRIAARTMLPEGPFFAKIDPAGNDEEEEALAEYFGTMGTADKAKYLASLYLDDLSVFIGKTLDPLFTLGKYAGNLCQSLPVFTPLLKELQKPEPTLLQIIMDDLAREMVETGHPDFVGISIPFPGTLYSAFRIAAAVKNLSPNTKIIFGGGFVNSELRSLEDERVFDFVDYISFDEGFAPLSAIISGSLIPAGEDCSDPLRNKRVLARDGFKSITGEICQPSPLRPDYQGLALDKYFSVAEMPNPMHRIWSDGLWLKMQLARGCYWHKCAFCDLALDYIGRYDPSKAADIADAMEKIMRDTGRCGFHFTDEALSPALLRSLCQELVNRKMNVTWWGNIRFDKSFTPELVQLMADSGCVAVTGGLECANDRLLKLMNKGITLESARRTFCAFADAGIMVHAYLMYGFPSETAEEAMGALNFVRGCFREGLIQSAFWHRFALTAHSAIAAEPDKFGIRIIPEKLNGPRFALNELRYSEKNQPDWNRIGKALETAVYNYMIGRGLDISPAKWLTIAGR